MRRFKVLFACIFILGAIGLNGSQSVFAQSWPSERITIVVPFTAGPGLDFVTRVIAEKLSKALGQTVIIENRPGANGRVASQYVAQPNPDGYTILAGVTSTHATSVHLVKYMGYDPVKDFTPIIMSVETIGCIVVNKILNSPDVHAKLESNGYRVVGGTSGEFASRIRNDIEFYGRLIKAAGIQPE